MVRVSQTAKRDLKEIHSYIMRDSQFYADKVINKIIEKISNLDMYPNMGRIVPEINNSNVREIFIYSYRIIYQLLNEYVEVVAIVHSKREIPFGS